MEDATSSNAALMRRIVQLETERDDLRRDVETLCMQQSGQISSGGDIMSRLQARRTAGLEQELDSCRQKLLVFRRENENLQEELSEAYRIKSKFAELYKVESEMNKNMEGELKYFQTNIAVALADRDRLTMQVEKSRAEEAVLQDELIVCKRLREEAVYEKEENLKQMDVLHDRVQRLNSEGEVFHQIVTKFWKLRQGSSPSEATGTLDMATSLLSDPEEVWAFGETARTSRQLQEKVERLESTNANLQEEICATKTELADLRAELDKQTEHKMNALQSTTDLRTQLAHFGATVTTRLNELKAIAGDVRQYLDGLVAKEVATLESLFQEAVAKCAAAAVSKSSTATGSNDAHVSQDQGSVSQEAFVRVLQEKVGALLLLSQQEERYHLEEKKIGALECQLNELNERLSEVTQEKVDALLKVAQLKYEYQQLEDRERDLLRLLQKPSSGNAGGRLLPAAWAKPDDATVDDFVVSKETRNKQHSSRSGYIRSWLTGLDLYGSGANHKETPIHVARSRIENAALQERIASLQQLLKAANRLRATLAKANESHEVEDIKAELSLVDGVTTEAHRLKTALSCTLPVSSGGDVVIENSNSPADISDKSTVELVSAAGMALVELLDLAAGLQRASLSAKVV